MEFREALSASSSTPTGLPSADSHAHDDADDSTLNSAEDAVPPADPMQVDEAVSPHQEVSISDSLSEHTSSTTTTTNSDSTLTLDAAAPGGLLCLALAHAERERETERDRESWEGPVTAHKCIHAAHKCIHVEKLICMLLITFFCVTDDAELRGQISNHLQLCE